MNAFQQTPTFGRRLYKNPVLWVFAGTLVVLAIHPIPECVACEFPRPWGRDDVAFVHASMIFDVWFIGASLTAGFCSLRKYWLVPVAITLAHLITQPLGRVALWSLWSNEGPVIIGFGVMAGGISLLFGALVRLGVDRLRTALS